MSPPLQIKCPEPECPQKGTWSSEARNSGGGEITQVTYRCPEAHVHYRKVCCGITSED
jgi:hypothetical protein